MLKSTLIVLSNPMPGRDDEYNDWYTNRHLGDVLKVPGIVSATRLKMKGAAISANAWQYCALYDVEHDDPQAVLDELVARAGSEQMPLSEAFDLEGICAAIYEPFAHKSR